MSNSTHKQQVLDKFPQAYAYRYAGNQWGVRTDPIRRNVIGQPATTQMGAWRKAWEWLEATSPRR